MSPQEVLGRIVRALGTSGIPYMFTGSFAAAIHGSPRATQDIDLVVDPSPEQFRALAGLLPHTEYYFDLNSALEALRHRSQVNLIDLSSGWKIDLIVRKNRPFSLREFQRKATVDFGGLTLSVVTLEDLILAKLEWAKLGQSDRQIEDVGALLRLRQETLDIPYLTAGVQELGVASEWEAARQRAGI